MKKKIAVIGAGPAGITAAYKLSKFGHKVDIYEAHSSVGGMAKTVKLWEQLVDLGPHRFFSSDPRVNSLWLEVIGSNYQMINRLTRIYYGGKFFDYPLKPLNTLYRLGVFQTLICVLSFFKAKLFSPKKIITFEDWVIKNFGKKLFNIFFKSYSEKLWGIPCNKLDADFAAQRIKKLSLYEAIKSSILGNKNSKHKTLVDQFAYPNGGTGQIYENMAKEILRNNNSIFLNTPIIAALPISKNNPKAIVKINENKSEQYDHIISTMPLTKLIEQMDAPNYIKNHSRSLKFRNTILVYLNVDSETKLFPDQWIYIQDNELRSGRVTNFDNWLSINKNQKNTILCFEYWCNDEDELWSLSELDLIKIAKDDISKLCITLNYKVQDGKSIKLPKCYPVYESGYKNHLSEIERYLADQEGLSVIGRYGSFKYNNQDHSILMGLLSAENIHFNSDHNLWKINNDYEYQESTRISKTGLEKI